MPSAKQRVLQACEFRRPDRIPRFDGFWEFPDSWRQRLGDPEDLTDVSIWYPDETPFPSRARHLKEADGYIYEIDAWGRTVRRRPGAFFVETLETPIADGARLDSIRFDLPTLNSRYLTGRMDPPVTYGSVAEMHEGLAGDKRRFCVFGKTGGPYLRSTYVRGETALLTDCAADPSFARAVADKVGEHLTAVGLEQLRRWDLYDTGIWIYDDMAYNRGPMFSPKQFEIVFLPAYRRMIRAYKEAGARYVFLHSDGDVRTILDGRDVQHADLGARHAPRDRGRGPRNHRSRPGRGNRHRHPFRQPGDPAGKLRRLSRGLHQVRELRRIEVRSTKNNVHPVVPWGFNGEGVEILWIHGDYYWKARYHIAIRMRIVQP